MDAKFLKSKVANGVVIYHPKSPVLILAISNRRGFGILDFELWKK